MKRWKVAISLAVLATLVGPLVTGTWKLAPRGWRPLPVDERERIAEVEAHGGVSEIEVEFLRPTLLGSVTVAAKAVHDGDGRVMDGPAAMATTISHEAGHSFGLLHHSLYNANGTNINEYNPGTSTWTPIMGDNKAGDRTTWQVSFVCVILAIIAAIISVKGTLKE